MDVSRAIGQNLYAVTSKVPAKKANEHNPTQAKQNNEKSGVEINISNEGRSRQLAERQKPSADNSLLDGADIEEFKTALNGSNITRVNFSEFTDAALLVDRSRKLHIGSDDSQQEQYRKELLNATSLYGRVDSAVTSADDFNSLSSRYMELRKGIEEKYCDEELDEQLKWLDESYDNAVNTLAEHAIFGIKSSSKIYEMSVKVNNDLVKHGQTHGHTFGISVKDMVTYDKVAFDSSVKTLIQNVQNSIKNFGILAKQYMLDSNDPTDKNNFEAYISQGTDESKGLYSLSDIDMLKTIFDPIGDKDTKSTLYETLGKLENSNISNSLKAAIVRMTTQSDEMFSVVPDAYKELEKTLYESMAKWEKGLDKQEKEVYP